MLNGLAVILTDVAPDSRSSRPAAPVPAQMPLNREFLRVIANMVLQSQAQVKHVY